MKKFVINTLKYFGFYLLRQRDMVSLHSLATPGVFALLQRYQIECNSILHIGGHFAEEASYYYNQGIQRCIFIEGDPEVFSKMEKVLSDYPSYKGVKALLSSKEETLTFNVNTERPDITFDKFKTLTSVTLDSLSLGFCDLIVIDVQGSEANVIAGGQETIRKAKVIWIEVEAGESYENSPDSSDIVAKLSEDFIPLYINMNENKWGDALFMNRSLI
ncbi:MAG: FkbM family methyltransferase [Burkholderiaceae bacterium]|nr:FkbM family methyltransferase [Burkholderiaceae bacterium]